MSQKRVLPPSLLLGHTPHLASLHVSSLSVGGEGAWDLSPEGGAWPSREVAPGQGDSGSAQQTSLSKDVWSVKVGQGLWSSCFCPFSGAAAFAGVPACQEAELGQHHFSPVDVAGGCSAFSTS